MRSVRISPKHARTLIAVVNAFGARSPSEEAALDALRAGLAIKPAVRAARKAKAVKKAVKRDKTAEIRAAVFARANGACEFWCGRSPSDLHHAFGRVRVRQSARNCLALCSECHRALTLNHGGSTYWWSKVALAFARLGFNESHEMAGAHEEKSAAKERLDKLCKTSNQGAAHE